MSIKVAVMTPEPPEYTRLVSVGGLRKGRHVYNGPSNQNYSSSDAVIPEERHGSRTAETAKKGAQGEYRTQTL